MAEKSIARYVAFLRGVSPTNAKMPELKKAFERAGFTDVKTILSSGNVVFDAKRQRAEEIEKTAEAAMKQQLGKSFFTIVRAVDDLEKILKSDPYAKWAVPPEAKKVVTFLREARRPAVPLPLEQDGARVLVMKGREVFTAYLPSPHGPVFMNLIEKAFGTEVTTRTWLSMEKCARA